MPKLSGNLSLLLLTLAALALRLHRIGYESLWADEARQVSYYSLPPGQLVRQAAGQAQPPLDYLIGMVLNRLGLDGDDGWVRLPAAIFGAGSVFLLGLLVKHIVGRSAGLFAAALLAVCPLHVAMSQEARPYAIFLFFLLATLCSLIHAKGRGSRASLLLLGGCVFAMLMSRWDAPHVFMMGLMAGLILVHRRAATGADRENNRRGRRRLMALALTIAGAYLLYAPFFLLIARGHGGFVRPTTDSAWERIEVLVGDAWRACLIGPPGAPAAPTWLMLTWSFVLLAHLAAGVYLLLRNARANDAAPIVLLLAGAGLFPILYPFAYVVLTVFPHKAQYLLPMTVILFAAAGVAIARLRQRLVRRPRLALCAQGCALAVLAAPMAVASFRTLHTREKSDWRGALTFLRQHAGDGDVFMSLRPFSLPGSMGAPVVGQARYFNADQDFLELRCDTTTAAIDAEPWLSRDNTVWVLCNRSAGAKKIWPLPVHLPRAGRLHAFHDLMLLEIRPSTDPSAPIPSTAAERLMAALACLDRACPDRAGMIAENLFRARYAMALGRREIARAATIAAYRHCRDSSDTRIVAQFLPLMPESLSAGPADD